MSQDAFFESDLYEALGVGKDASAAEIKAAYRRLAHRWHPDKNSEDPKAEERFKITTRAYEVLANPASRRRYDRMGMRGVRLGESGAGAAVDFADRVGDVLKKVVSEALGRDQDKNTHGAGIEDVFSGESRKTSSELLSKLSLEWSAAVVGGVFTVTGMRRAACVDCQGLGAASDTPRRPCGACGARGEVRVGQGMFHLRKRCGMCAGRGFLSDTDCGKCEGSGLINTDATLEVQIPAGVEDGEVLRFVGHGHAPAPDKTLGGDGTKHRHNRHGDWLVVLSIASHPQLRREGYDVHLDVPIPVPLAVLGGHIHVPTLRGVAKVKIPAGSQPNAILRMARLGFPHRGRSHGKTGDQWLTLKVELPVVLDAQSKACWEKLALECDEAAWDKDAQGGTKRDMDGMHGVYPAWRKFIG